MPPKPWQTLIVLFFVVLFAWFLLSFSTNNSEIPHEDGSIEVVFCPMEDCEGTFVSYLENASEIICAFYDLRLEKLTATLSSKNADVIVFDEYADKVPSGLEFTPVHSSGLMHNKFCVLDDSIVITGSMNPTQNGAYKNDNNLLFIHSRILAARYAEEFSEIKEDKRETDGPTTVNLSGMLLTVRFCPKDDCENAVLSELSKAKKSVRFMTFSFTSDAIGDALLAVDSRDVTVLGVFEKRQKSKWSEYEKLASFGMNVSYDGNPQTMHHKVFIIDDEVVITGSYNPTKNGNERNDENLLILHDKEIATEFLDEFERVLLEANT